LNFLAHLFLSGDDKDLLIGNFIADFVKGRKYEDYSPGIRNGILLHRKIDTFTDHHPVTARSRELLRLRHRHYSGVIVDLYYDHFLARNFHEYSGQDLRSYSLNTYEILDFHKNIFPDGVRYFLPFMIERNWLLNYATLEGINRALTGLSGRVRFENRMDEAIRDLEAFYPSFEADFREFFPELITFVEKEIA
jgi:acyl carrier protein phosphodiesterase